MTDTLRRFEKCQFILPVSVMALRSPATRSTVAVLKRQREKLARRVLLHRWRLVKGDKVEICNGPDAGKQGVIKRVVRDYNSVVIDGLNMRKRVIPATAQSTGFIKLVPGLVHHSRVALVDPIHNKQCKVKFGWDAQGNKVRVSKLSGTIIPKPDSLKAAGTGNRIVNRQTDTDGAAVQRVTYTGIDLDAVDSYISSRRQAKKQQKQEEEQKQQTATEAAAIKQQQQHNIALPPDASLEATITTTALQPSTATATEPVAASPSSSVKLPPAARYHRGPNRIPRLPPFPYTKASELVGKHAERVAAMKLPAGIEYAIKH